MQNTNNNSDFKKDLEVCTKLYDNLGSRHLVFGSFIAKPKEGIRYDRISWYSHFDKGLFLVPGPDDIFTRDSLECHLDHARRRSWNSIGQCIVRFLEERFNELIIMLELREHLESLKKRSDELSETDLRSAIDFISYPIYVDRVLLQYHLRVVTSMMRVYGSRAWRIFHYVRLNNIKLIKHDDVQLWGDVLLKYPRSFDYQTLLNIGCVEINPGPIVGGNGYPKSFSIGDLLLRGCVEPNPGPSFEEFPEDIREQLTNPKMEWFVTPMRTGSMLFSSALQVIRNTVFSDHYYLPRRVDVTPPRGTMIKNRTTIITVEWDSHRGKFNWDTEPAIIVGSRTFKYHNIGYDRMRVSASVGTNTTITIKGNPCSVIAEVRNFVVPVKKRPIIHDSPLSVDSSTFIPRKKLLRKERKFKKAFYAIPGPIPSKGKTKEERKSSSVLKKRQILGEGKEVARKGKGKKKNVNKSNRKPLTPAQLEKRKKKNEKRRAKRRLSSAAAVVV